MDQNQDRRRGHFHRGRRGMERRGGPDRRTPPPPQQQGRDQVDVEQIMREIRARIAQRQGIDLSNQQIQDLAARRLESVLDPRAIKPSLLEGLRRSAGMPPASVPTKAPSEPVYTFEDVTIYDSHRGILRFIRRLLNPLLKLFFNPNPLIRALHVQAKLNVEAAEREAERDRRQMEWNALHYEIVQRLVTEVSRASLELQALSMRVESLAARVDFNDRRVRSLEGAAQARPAPRAAEPHTTVVPPEAPSAESPAETSPIEGARRRRRRRRGRRGNMFQAEPGPHGPAGPSTPSPMPAPTESDAVGEVEMHETPFTPADEPVSMSAENVTPVEHEIGQGDAAPAAAPEPSVPAPPDPDESS